MHKPLVSMIFPVIFAHIIVSEIHYPNLIWKELCGKIAHLIADSVFLTVQIG